MSGMEALGRLVNVIPIAAGKPFKMRGASGVLFVVTGNDTFTLKASSSFGGAYSALTAINDVYWTTGTDGTAAWNKFRFLDAANGGALVNNFKIGAGGTAGLTTATAAAFHVFTSQLSDPNDYLEVTVAATGLVTAIPYDLVTQRGPANLEILGA